MPIYNGIEFIHQSVHSILYQTMDEWELIIGINGHEPNSEVYETAKNFEYVSDRIRVLELYPIKGKAEALNEMVKYAKYSYVALLDVDDIWYPNKLEMQLPFINEGYDVIGTKCVYFGNPHCAGAVPDIPTGNFSDFDFLQFNPVINSSSVIKKELAYWDGYFNGVEDYCLWLELRRLGKRFYNCDEILVRHRIHEESAFNSKGNINRVPELLRKYACLREI